MVTDVGYIAINMYHSVEQFLERVNAKVIGALLWTAIGALLLVDRPVNLEILLLPVGGAITAQCPA